MRKYLTLVFGALLVLTGCNLACDAEKVVTEKFSVALAKVGNCSQPQEIQKDLMSALEVVNLCTAKKLSDERCKDLPTDLKQGPIANLVCPLLSNALVAVAGTTVPARYGCNLSGSPLNALVLQACQTLPF